MKKRKKNKIILASIIIIAVAVLFFFIQRSSSNQEVGNNGETQINYDPPTGEEQQSGDKQKQAIVDDEGRETPEQPESSAQLKKANVIIVDAAQYEETVEVRSFVSNHYADGSCTFTFSQGALRVFKTAPAYRDATTTICTNPLIKRVEFPAPGSWQLVVGYAAPGAEGRSAVQTIKIE